MSKKSPYPDTSREAYQSLHPTEVREMYRRIREALLVIGEGTFEDISSAMSVEPSRVWKRLGEMQKMGIIYRPGIKKPLKSGRNGYIWKITDSSQPNNESVTENKPIPGPSVSDYSRKLIQQEMF